MDWFLSAIMILFYFLAGNKWKYTWILSFFVNLLWTYYAWDIGQYGLIPSSTILGGVAIYNHFKWLKESK
jgi:hypothetical protein